MPGAAPGGFLARARSLLNSCSLLNSSLTPICVCPLVQGLPFRGMAEKMGAAVLPTLQAARDAERQAKRQARRAAEEAEVVVPVVPHVLPFTRWCVGEAGEGGRDGGRAACASGSRAQVPLAKLATRPSSFPPLLSYFASMQGRQQPEVQEHLHCRWVGASHEKRAVLAGS